MTVSIHTCAGALTAALCFVLLAPIASALDLSDAAIVAPKAEKVYPRTIDMLQDEIESRTGVRLGTAESATQGKAAIVLGTPEDFPGGMPEMPAGVSLNDEPDSYAIWMDEAAKRVYLVGAEPRNALLAAGHLIRLLDLGDGKATLETKPIAAAPAERWRVHQLGYRNTANSYDLWDVDQYEQYLRDMIIFGANGAELIQEGDRERRDSPLMAMSQWDMNVKLAGLMDEYGLDVWVWQPMLVDAGDAEAAQAELELWDDFFSEMPRIDYIFVPGGDPGSNPPETLLPWCEKAVERLHKHFPDAELLISNQKFPPEADDYFFSYLQEKQPEWFGGSAFGPSSKDGIDVMRERLPKQYPIRRYPDITHTVRAQYAMPHLDPILAQTLERECTNPRPRTMTYVHNAWAEYVDGFGSYSDGVHDDFNKMLWSRLGIDPDTDVDIILEDYGRVFFGPGLGEDTAKGMRMLEENMLKPILDNEEIEKAYKHWMGMDEKGGESLGRNWRFQMHLFRAMFDHYIRERHIVEMGYQREAYEALAKADAIGVEDALMQASEALAQADMNRVLPELRIELEKKGLLLLELIGLQYSIDEPYRARNPERGALLDKADRPLNDRPWLEAQFAEIEAMGSKGEKLARIERIVNWDDPGPGGYYDDLGHIGRQPRLVQTSNYEDDPGFIKGPMVAFYRTQGQDKSIEPLKLSWVDYAETEYNVPITLHYDNLDPNAEYKVRVTYFGRYHAPLRLVADGEHEIHGGFPEPSPVWPVEFDIPEAATQDGKLTLEWHLAEGRGPQLPEVWLIKK